MALEQQGIDAVLLLVALEQEAEFVVAYLSDESRRHSEHCRTSDGIGGGASGNIVYVKRLELVPDHVPGLPVDMLHAPQGEMEGLQEGVVGQDGQDVRQCVADAEDGFHTA